MAVGNMDELYARGDQGEGEGRQRSRVVLGTIAVAIVLIALLLLLLPKLVTVPDVRGLSEEKAQAKLEKAGFVLGTVATKSADKPAGSVTDQHPLPGDRALRGTVVNITIVSGAGVASPKPDDDGPAEVLVPRGKLVVPNVVGKFEDPATVRVARYGLDVAIRWESGPEMKGRVIAQSPEAGEPIAPGRTVTLTLSNGLPYDKESVGPFVPSVLDKSRSRATAILKSAGYGVRFKSGPSTTEVAVGSAYYQKPAAGAQASRGTVVTVWLSNGAPVDGHPYPTPGN